MTLNKQRYILALLAILSFQQSATASVPQSDATYETSSEVNSQNANSNEQIKQKKYLTNEKQKEETIKEKACFWGLSVEEWHRFEKIKEQGGRGYWSPNLDPLTTLGVEAETKEEREHYAKLLAKKEFERTEKELEFQRIYDQMFKCTSSNLI